MKKDVGTLNRGFILLVVISLLGVLAFLALQLVQTSRANLSLSGNSVGQSRAHLLALSGLERTALTIRDMGLETGSDTYELELDFSHTVDFGKLEVNTRDANSCINLNDGISAGALDVDHNTYSASDITHIENERIVKLLNGYGLVVKFINDLGLPVSWKYAYNLDKKNYGTAFEHPSMGLGDSLIAQRPEGGFRHITETKKLFNDWGLQELGIQNFFSTIRQDFVLNAREDNRVFRQTRDIARTGYLKRLDEFPPDLTVDNNNLKDKNNFLVPHPVSLINLNGASVNVKAAVYASLEEVLYSAEGIDDDDNYEFLLDFMPTPTKDLGARSFHKPQPLYWNTLYSDKHVPTVGTRPHSYNSVSKALENGEPTDTLKNGRFLSIRDCLVIARSHQHYNAIEEPPESFDDYYKMLGAFRNNSTPPTKQYLSVEYEKQLQYPIHPFFANVNRLNNYDGVLHTTSNQTQPLFDQRAVEETLPHVLSGVRRMPGWMNAPLALLSPYIQFHKPRNQLFTTLKEVTRPGPDTLPILYSIEDFVKRHQHPKIIFLPGGIYHVVSEVNIGLGKSTFRSTIECDLDHHTTTILRTQEDFLKHTDNTHKDRNLLKFGPEPEGVDPSRVMGVVGLKDRVENVEHGNRPHSIFLTFDGTLTSQKVGDKNYNPENGDEDPFNNDVKEISEKWPVLAPGGSTGGPLDFTQAYDTNFMTACRTQTSPDFTWRVPKSPLRFLNETFGTLPYGHDKVNSQERHFTESSPRSWIGSGVSYLMLFHFPLKDYGNTTTDYQSNAFAFLKTIYALVNPSVRGGMPINSLAFQNSDLGLNPANLDRVLWEVMPSIQKRFGYDLWRQWFDKWQSGLHPSKASEPDHHLHDSALEGPDVSIFKKGSEGTDLSPFGGVSFSSRGHGLRAGTVSKDNTFQDSLYFRPYKMLGAGQPGMRGPTTGSVFNKGTVSLWVRVPSGARFPSKRTLFSLKLWERTELINNRIALTPSYDVRWPGSGPMYQQTPFPFPPLMEVYRPVHITCLLDNAPRTNPYPDIQPDFAFFNSKNAHFQIAEGDGFGLASRNKRSRLAQRQPVNFHNELVQKGLTTQPMKNKFYPPYSGHIQLDPVRYPRTPLTAPHNAQTVNLFPDDFMGLGNQGYKTSHSTIDNQRWDIAFMSFKEAQNVVMKGSVNQPNMASAKNYVEFEDYPYVPGSWVRVIVDWNLGKQLVALSNQQALGRPSGFSYRRLRAKVSTDGSNRSKFGTTIIKQSSDITFNPEMVLTLGEKIYFNPKDQNYESHQRLNSTIDNVDIRFGGNVLGHTGPGTENLNATSNLSGYASWRYPIRPPNPITGIIEPEWVLNPQFERETKLLSVGARIYDVPIANGYFWRYRAPWVDLDVYDNGTTVVPLKDKSFTGNSPHPIFSWITKFSPEKLRYQSTRVGPDTRITLKYRATNDIDGKSALMGPMLNIPWIKEVTWRAIRPGGVRYLNYNESN